MILPLYITGNLGRANNIQLMTSFISSLNACNFVILWVLSPHFHTPVPNNKCIKSSSAEKMSWRLSFTEWHSGFRNNIDIKAAFFWILTTFLKNLSLKWSINLMLQKLKTFFFRYLKFTRTSGRSAPLVLVPVPHTQMLVTTPDVSHNTWCKSQPLMLVLLPDVSPVA